MSAEQQWHYADSAGQELGPVSADQLQQLAASGQINGETNVWTEGLEAWVPASQVDGLLPNTPATAPPPIPAQAPPLHTPQINLGPGSVTQPGTAPAPYIYQKPKKSPLKWIVLGIIGVVVIGFGIMIAIAPSEEEKRANIPGYAAYSDANSLVTGTTKGGVHGNNAEAKSIAKEFATMLKTYREAAIEEAKPGLINKDGIFPTYCLAVTKDGQKTVVIIVQVPKLRKFADDAKKTIVEGAWIAAKLALNDTPYSADDTILAVGVRGMALYETVMVGHPLMTKKPSEQPLEGVTDTHTSGSPQEQLYKYFISEQPSAEADNH